MSHNDTHKILFFYKNEAFFVLLNIFQPPSSTSALYQTLQRHKKQKAQIFHLTCENSEHPAISDKYDSRI